MQPISDGRNGSELASPEEIRAALLSLPGWRVSPKGDLKGVYELADAQLAFFLVGRVVQLAELQSWFLSTILLMGNRAEFVIQGRWRGGPSREQLVQVSAIHGLVERIGSVDNEETDEPGAGRPYQQAFRRVRATLDLLAQASPTSQDASTGGERIPEVDASDYGLPATQLQACRWILDEASNAGMNERGECLPLATHALSLVHVIDLERVPGPLVIDVISESWSWISLGAGQVGNQAYRSLAATMAERLHMAGTGDPEVAALRLLARVGMIESEDPKAALQGLVRAERCVRQVERCGLLPWLLVWKGRLLTTMDREEEARLALEEALGLPGLAQHPTVAKRARQLLRRVMDQEDTAVSLRPPDVEGPAEPGETDD